MNDSEEAIEQFSLFLSNLKEDLAELKKEHSARLQALEDVVFPPGPGGPTIFQTIRKEIDELRDAYAHQENTLIQLSEMLPGTLSARLATIESKIALLEKQLSELGGRGPGSTSIGMPG